jgi:CheY-like chemotaxis protein
MASILYVDDDPYTLETLSRASQVIGHQAYVAGSGEEGIKIAAERIPDLIFTDLNLTDMDGLMLIERLNERAATAQIPVFILSASPEEDIINRAQAAGAKAYLNKPVRLQTLMDIIRDYVPK